MPLAANSLSTWAALRDELGLSDDVLKARGEGYLSNVSDEAERLCGRRFARAAGVVELVVPGSLRVLIGRPPLLAVASITEDGAAVDASGYSVANAEAGIILRESGWCRRLLGYEGAVELYRANVQVTYAGGYVLPGTTWSAAAAFPAGAFAKPTSTSNFNVFQCSGDGVTGNSEPSWPATVGNTVADGTLTWTNVGHRTLPGALERIALNGAIQLWRTRGRQRAIRQETVGAASRTFAQDVTHPFFAPEDLQALDVFRLPLRG